MSFIPSSITSEIHKASSAIEHEGGKIYRGVKSGVKSAGSTLEKGAQTVKSDLGKAAQTIGSEAEAVQHDVVSTIQKVPDAISAAGHYVQSGVLQIGDTLSTFEGDVAPSFNKIIGETGLVIAGIIAIALVALKF